MEMRVVVLGLDNAGKSTILVKLKQNEFIPTIPTIGKLDPHQVHCAAITKAHIL